jgi:V8-like Glu-specific endopeptidase
VLDDVDDTWAPRWADVPPAPSDRGPRAVAARGGPPPAPAPASPDRPVPSPVVGTGLPWSAVGRIDVPGGWGSGVLVGPRHLLTASHVVVWDGRAALNGHGSAPIGDRPGWLRFTPAAAPGRAPHGSADAVAVHYPLAVLPPSIEAHEERFDYAVCVLDRRIGDEVGWLGVRGYHDAWNGASVWTLTGYRGASSADAVQVAVTRLFLDGHDDQAEDSQVIFHPAVVEVGLSGGPVLAQWPEDVTPSVVAVQSWSNEHRSGACGGTRMVELVEAARRAYP